ncbi:hypothetical protein NBRC116589_08450 [Ruegeria sp. HU-ET01832]
MADTASSAAPGVDQATLIGCRYHRLNPIAVSPIAIAAIIKPDADCAADAPIAASPCNTIGNELKKPTIATTNPVETVWSGGAARVIWAWGGVMCQS